jgi:Asp-tRNA(Asn)/Glu-tRNA(Gln) amidotransferase A subunit family amidase
VALELPGRFSSYPLQPYNVPKLTPKETLKMAEESATGQGPISPEEIAAAEKLIGLEFTEAERSLMVKNVNENLAHFQKLRTVPLENSVSPALHFKPIGPAASPSPVEVRKPIKLSPISELPVPSNLEELAFYPVTHLAHLLKNRQITSVALTEMYLNRLKRYGPRLECVVTLTEELALAQAQHADEEIAAGRYRGPLHGIPWGAKDLLATKGFPTTWGATPYKDQVIETDAAVVERLEAAGAVLIAKLTLGALAYGDVWFGGKTRTPWKLDEGSSGSSAGSGAATGAGLVGFSIGTETHGSIVSPCTQCGVTGLRPTFGRVSRYGAMALSWSMDKIGPMCRSVEDCAAVFQAIYGPDGRDLAVVDAPFEWNPRLDLAHLRIGYLKSAFEAERENRAPDDEALALLSSLGINLIPVELPESYPIQALELLLVVEAAAAFDELTRSNRDDLLVRQDPEAWPNLFRQARLIPAVEYIQANRIRALVMQAMAKVMAEVDVYVAPSFAEHNLLSTNLTGHPTVVVPHGFTAAGLPTSLSFIGRLYDEATVLAVAKAYQDATDFHLKHPPLDQI